MLKILATTLAGISIAVLFSKQTFPSTMLAFGVFLGTSILHIDLFWKKFADYIKVKASQFGDFMKMLWNKPKAVAVRRYTNDMFAEMPLLTVALPISTFGLIVQHVADGWVEAYGLVIWMIGLMGITFDKTYEELHEDEEEG